MELLVLFLILIAIFIAFLPETEEEIDNNSNNLEKYKLNHCNLHKWISKPTGFEDNSTYTVCEICKFNPVTNQYE